MIETAQFSACTECQNCIVRESAVAHCRYIQQRTRVRLFAIWTSDCDPRVLWIDMFRPYRVLHPLVALAVHILLCAEGYSVSDGLGSLVRYCSVRPVERYPARLSVTLNQVLANLRTNAL